MTTQTIAQTTSAQTISILALAVALGLGNVALAGEGKHKNKEMHASHATEQASDTLVASRIGKAEYDRLTRDFGKLDRDDDGFVLIADIDAVDRTHLVRFDADNDGRLDRYEYDMARSARFHHLDMDGDGFVSRTELDDVKPEYVSFVALDSDNDQQLSMQEYHAFLESGDWVRDRDRYAFEYVDRDVSDNIDNDEASVYVPLASRFTAFDPDGDGLIERTEYEVFLTEIDVEQRRDDRVAGTDEQPASQQDR